MGRERDGVDTERKREAGVVRRERQEKRSRERSGRAIERVSETPLGLCYGLTFSFRGILSCLSVHGIVLLQFSH